jgi:hypothetical protein
VEIVAGANAAGERPRVTETSVALGDYPIDGSRPNRVEIVMRFMHSNPGPTEEQHGSQSFHE